MSIPIFTKKQNIAPDNEKFLQSINQCLAKPIRSLWYSGLLPAERKTCVAVVGTRKPTTYGREVTYRLSYELASRGIIIVSGLALGIDGIAHQAALDAGGTTIAILPTSLDDIYPFSHRGLAKRIIENGGALITEYDGEGPAYKGNFIARNRIVSALSDGLLITEAAERSGTSTTAGFALEQGKPVMAVPGNITSPMSIGCNNLIQRGAKVITCVEDILEEIGLTSQAQAKLPLAYSPEQKIILDLLSAGLRDGDELQKQSDLEPSTFSQTLTMLEIEGKVRPLGANQWGL
ncbi:MAG TPA: DNA-processing protein DprA [Candidatus Acidoferrum sp.]|nr:DNA-processing protein DprA [Candidatus Acidoferrum sp.]